MYYYLLVFHSLIRYLVLLLLIAVIVLSFSGLIFRRNYLKADRIALVLLTSFSHLQLTLGIVLYFISPLVVFTKDVMQNELFRYWTIEHIMMMITAVVFISVPGLSVKKLNNDQRKHKRTFWWTLPALILIISAIIMSQRPFFHWFF